MFRVAIISGVLFAMTSVILGAFGAHALKEILSEDMLQTFETGVRYQMYHGLGLLMTGLISVRVANSKIKYATYFFILGIFLFSGSLYILSLLKANGLIGLGGLGLLTPIGGVFFILGWVMLLISIMQKDSK